ncbi:uncharacterized protein AAES06_000905 isoform 1-T1 [Glossophaga mutica]
MNLVYFEKLFHLDRKEAPSHLPGAPPQQDLATAPPGASGSTHVHPAVHAQRRDPPDPGESHESPETQPGAAPPPRARPPPRPAVSAAGPRAPQRLTQGALPRAPVEPPRETAMSGRRRVRQGPTGASAWVSSGRWQGMGRCFLGTAPGGPGPTHPPQLSPRSGWNEGLSGRRGQCSCPVQRWART